MRHAKEFLLLPQSSLAFPLGLRFSLSASSSTICNKCRLRAQDSRHGWQAGKLHISSLGKRLFYHRTTPARCLIALANRLGVRAFTDSWSQREIFFRI